MNQSSRGRSSEGLLKPEISAPGNNIVSCGTGTDNYAIMSGTRFLQLFINDLIINFELK
jgi:hypothetical protein